MSNLWQRIKKLMLNAGFEKKQIDMVAEDIAEYNTGAFIYSVMAVSFIFVALFIASIFLRFYEGDTLLYAINGVLFLALLGFSYLKRDFIKAHYSYFILLLRILAVAFSCYVDIYISADELGVQFAPCLVMFGVLFVESPYKNTCGVLAALLFYILWDYSVKSTYLFLNDALMAIAYGFFCILTNIIVSKNKISAFWANYELKEIQLKQKEQELRQAYIKVQETEHQASEQLRISNTDELTGLNNRHAFETDIKALSASPLPPELAYISADINGLKCVNDSNGHMAGDELIKGAAFCLQKIYGRYGKVYRTGGDEFIALIELKGITREELRNQMVQEVSSWSGDLVKELSISIGFVVAKEYPNADLHALGKLADESMYQKKNAYYINKGVDRIGQQLAYATLCSSYLKILRVNLTDGSYSLINYSKDELIKEKGYDNSVFNWLKGFADAGMVHTDDLPYYRKITDPDGLRNHFRSGSRYISVHYRRLINGQFRRVLLEFRRAEDYDDNNQLVYLYVKDIE